MEKIAGYELLAERGPNRGTERAIEMSGETRVIGRIRDILSNVPRTEPPAKAQVTQLYSWDKMHRAIEAANNYLVAAQAERHKAEMALKDAKDREDEAEEIFERAKQQWIEQSRTLLGVDVGL